MNALSNLSNKPNRLRLSPAPPVLLFAGLVLWGWQTEFMLYAIIMGGLLELSYFVKWRIEFSDKDINQLTDLSSILFFLMIVYAFNTYSFSGIYKILELLPFVLILLMLAQKYSHRKGIKTSALFLSIRHLDTNAYEIDLGLPYFFICLISASAGNKNGDLFFVLSTLLMIAMLWRFKPKPFSFLRWLLPILIVCCTSYLMQNGLQQLQEESEKLFLVLFEKYNWESRDPAKTTTVIGSLGRLKLSDRIVMRLQSEKKLTTPLYFHEASYSLYEYGNWRNPNVEFELVKKLPGKNKWRINKATNDIGNMDVGLYLNDTSAIIPVPDKINTFTGKDLLQVETSVYGSTRIEAREGWIKYRLGYTDQNIIENAPDSEDLSISPHHAEDFKTIATELGLYSKSPQEISKTIETYFRKNFYYSMTQNQRYPKGKFLNKFLFQDKKGHCEYFATATALLLREAGIPARYTVGYSVQEYSPWQEAYIVRARHAHAWVQYYLDGEWRVLDTTPATWAPLEAEDKTILEPLMDMVSWLRYKFIDYDIEGDPGKNNLFLWLLLPLGGYLAWRFYNKQRIQQTKSLSASAESTLQRYGIDSPLYPFIENLEQQTDTRSQGETMTAWVKRTLPATKREAYIDLIKLHYRYRFNPISDKIKDRQSLINKLKFET